MMSFTTRLFIIILFGFITTSAFAKVRGNIVTPGFYLEVESGVSDVGYKSNFAPGYYASSVDTSGFANRIEGGFDITKNFGVLLSVVYAYKPELHNINGGLSSKVKNNIVYTALKAMLPIGRQFVIYFDGGFGYVARSAVIANVRATQPDGTVVWLTNQVALSDRLIVRPVYGLGMAYLFWTRWAVTLTWVQTPSKPSEQLPMINYVGAGIRYKFAT